MDTHEVNRVRAKLALYVADEFASVPRKDQRAKGDCYLRGLTLDGRRKSIQAMASRLPDGNEQNLQQFVNQSSWNPVPVQRRICERMLPLVNPTARNCRHVVSVCRWSAGGIFRRLRTLRIVEALTWWPSLSSSPWMRWYPTTRSPGRPVQLSVGKDR